VTLGLDITPQDLKSFITMWRRAFGATLSPEAAESEALRLIDFFLTLAEERSKERD
jgi:hypothetical protein